MITFSAWAKLEQLEEFLAFLVDDGKLKPDTLEYAGEPAPEWRPKA